MPSGAAWTPPAATVGIGLQPDPAAPSRRRRRCGSARSRPPGSSPRRSRGRRDLGRAASRLGARGWIGHLPRSRSSRFLALWIALSASLPPPVAVLMTLATLQAVPGGAAWAAIPAIRCSRSSRPAVLPPRAVPARRDPVVRGPGDACLPFDLIARRDLGSRILVSGSPPHRRFWPRGSSRAITPRVAGAARGRARDRLALAPASRGRARRPSAGRGRERPAVSRDGADAPARRAHPAGRRTRGGAIDPRRPRRRRRAAALALRAPGPAARHRTHGRAGAGPRGGSRARGGSPAPAAASSRFATRSRCERRPSDRELRVSLPERAPSTGCRGFALWTA
jgi:hypothetical protein